MSFEKIKKNFGFGCMRLKMDGDEVDHTEFCRMIDAFMDAGFNYFDTAHGYIDGKSELAVRECLTSRYEREDFVLANKLSMWYINEESDILPFFENQLKCCGVEYFDFYLFHAMNREFYEKCLDLHAFDIVRSLRDEGKIKHIAMSFHDTADVLDRILTEQPDIEAVQLQINYLDYDDPTVQSKACYDVAVKHGKAVLVMEPVKGGTLVNLPSRAAELFDRLGGGSYASYALRYAASFPAVFMVLSGMGSMEMVKDNTDTMSNFVPLSDEELLATDKAREIIREANQIGCTACNYCAEVCPEGIPISDIFRAYNAFVSARASRSETRGALEALPKAARECIECGGCESVCPQVIEIREKLKLIAKRFK